MAQCIGLGEVFFWKIHLQVARIFRKKTTNITAKGHQKLQNRNKENKNLKRKEAGKNATKHANSFF